MKRFIKPAIASFIIFIVFFNVYKSQGNSLASFLFRDEYSWISRSYFLELFLKGDFTNPNWETYGAGIGEGVDGDPKLTSYLYGLAIYPDYLREKSQREGEYDMINYLLDRNFFSPFMNLGVSARRNSYLGSSPDYINWHPRDFSQAPTLADLVSKYGEGFDKTVRLILQARFANYVALALSVVIAFFICRQVLKKFWASILGCLLYGSSPVVVASGLYAGTEGFSLLFFNLGFYLLLGIFSRQKFDLISLSTFALTVALLNQIKLSGVVLLVIFDLFALVTIIRKAGFRKNNQPRLGFLMVNLLFVLFYIALNPFLYQNTIRNIAFQYSWTYRLAQDQQGRFPEVALTNPAERAQYLTKSFFGKESILRPFFLEKVPVVARTFIFSVLPFFLLGAFRLVRKSYYELLQFWRRRDFFLSEETVLFLSFLFLILMALGYLLIGWERYLVQFVLPFWLISIWGVMSLGNLRKEAKIKEP